MADLCQICNEEAPLETRDTKFGRVDICAECEAKHANDDESHLEENETDEGKVTGGTERTDGAVVDDPLGDLSALRLNQKFGEEVAGHPVFTTIAVRKPGKQDFVRVLSGEEWIFETLVFVEEGTGTPYLIKPEVAGLISEHVRPTRIFLAIARESPVPFLWPVVLPGPDGDWNRWHSSAHEAAVLAQDHWLRITSDRAAGMYVPFVAHGDFPDPAWPENLTMEDYIRKAFKDRVIDSPEHPIVRRLRGEV